MPICPEEFGQLQEKVTDVVERKIPELKENIAKGREEAKAGFKRIRVRQMLQTKRLESEFGEKLKPVIKDLEEVKRLRRDMWVVMFVACAMLVLLVPSTWPAALGVTGKLGFMLKDIIKPT